MINLYGKQVICRQGEFEHDRNGLARRVYRAKRAERREFGLFLRLPLINS